MNRMNIQNGAIPLDTDLLNIQRFIQAAFDSLIRGTLGTGTLLDGFTCIPTTPASLAVQVTPGSIFELEPVDVTAFGSLPADASPIMKIGVLSSTQNFQIIPPATGGFAQNYLLQVQFSETDGVPVVLPFLNEQDPSDPFTGPNDSGAATNTQRICNAVFTLKAGIAAAVGTQVTPAPDIGGIGVFVVTVANGQTALTSGNIAILPSAPFIPGKLADVPAKIQNQTWTFAADTGSANTLVASITPAPAALTQGLAITVLVEATNTGPATLNLNSLGARPIVTRGGSPLLAGELLAGMTACMNFDGTRWQLTTQTAGQPIPSGTTMVFMQTVAPVGWTKLTAHDNKALRIVAGAAGSGGSTPFTTIFASGRKVTGTTDGTAIDISQMPSHEHDIPFSGVGAPNGSSNPAQNLQGTGSGVIQTESTGGGLPHDHTFTSDEFAMDIAYVDVILASRN